MAEIMMTNFEFEPQELKVQAGEEVVWRNEDTVNHTVTADDGSFDSGDVTPGSEYQYSFDAPGDCTYHCEYHPSMIGKITIE